MAARRQNAWWLTLALRGRPHVTYKAAVSADGRTASPAGPRWISSPESRARCTSCARRWAPSAVGIGTALADDPLLTARDVDPPAERQPLRVVFDRAARLPHRLAARGERRGRTQPGARRVRARARRRSWPPGVETLPVAGLAEALAELGRRRISALLLEGGATLATAFLDAGLIDRLMLFTAPIELGDGPGALHPAGRSCPAPVSVASSGPDILSVTELREP